MGIMRVFVTARESVSSISETGKRLSMLEKNFAELKQDLEEIFADYNDINENTRMQLDLLNESLAELQTNNKKSKGRPKIGFIP